MTSTTDNLISLSAVLPDGNGGWRPAPVVLTESELITLLRLDEPGGPRNPSETVRRYRDKGLLRGCRIGNTLRYPLGEVLRFLAAKVAADSALTGRDGRR